MVCLYRFFFCFRLFIYLFVSLFFGLLLLFGHLVTASRHDKLLFNLIFNRKPLNILSSRKRTGCLHVPVKLTKQILHFATSLT